jgi:hypothetical protein
LLLFLEVRLPPSSDEKRYSLSSVNIDRQSDGVNALMMSGLKTLFSTALSLLNAPGNLEKSRCGSGICRWTMRRRPLIRR